MRLFLVALALSACFVVAADGCSDSIVVPRKGVSVTSPGYPEKYPNNQNCITSISTESPLFCFKFAVKFVDLESHDDCDYDSVEIACGDEVLRKYCGRANENNVECERSAGEIRFRSDSTINGQGFVISVTPKVCRAYDQRSLYLTSKRGVITSPNYPNSYPSNMQYFAYIRVPSQCHIEMCFTDFDMEHNHGCTYDSLSVFNGNRISNSHRIGKYCHSHGLPSVVTTTSEAVVLMHSDGSVAKRGFRLEYKSICRSPCLPNPCANGGSCMEKNSSACMRANENCFECCCPAGYTGPLCEQRVKVVHRPNGGVSGYVRSPNFPQPYPNNALSDFVISAKSADARLRLYFQHFNVENSGECARDRLEIYDGDAACRAQLVGVFCGNVLPNVVVSSADRLLLRFVSDGDSGASGFHINFESLSAALSTSSVPRECLEDNGGCEHICSGGEIGKQCSCRPGFVLNPDGRTCRDLDECDPRHALHNCVHPAVCENAIGSFYCRCERNGYKLNFNGTGCEDVNECENFRIHFCEQNCTNTLGSYFCTCRDGYVLSANQKQCEDINECAVNNGGCDHSDGVCVNLLGSYECRCRRGFVTHPHNPSKCIDEDECSRFSPCSSELSCRPTEDGWYDCNCDEGYITDSTGYRGCIDANECRLNPDICGKGTCRNEEGTFACDCQEGFISPRRDSEKDIGCEDINECKTNKGGCYGNCTNIEGSFECSCPRGYRLAGDGKDCVDVNECINGSAECQHLCFNFNGSYECACNPGYYLAEDGRACLDVDECSTGNHNCSDLCENYAGSYQCQCYPGYALGPDRLQCVDIDECQRSNGGCQQRCINAPGNRSCRCESGYSSQDGGVTCQDIDECLDGPCNMTCQNTNGSYSCGCPSPIFVLDSNGIDCLDFDECAVDNGGCDHTCVNTYGSFQCTCRPGYEPKQNPLKCKDVNECKTENDCSHKCHNAAGSYYCSCPLGYELGEDNATCIDIDECSRNISKCNQICTNERGSFSCSCLSGYVANEQNFSHCDDIDECSLANGNCSGGCKNLDGSYMCTCKDNEKLDRDGHLCLTCPTCSDFTALENKLKMLESLTNEQISTLTEQVLQLEKRLQLQANQTDPV